MARIRQPVTILVLLQIIIGCCGAKQLTIYEGDSFQLDCCQNETHFNGFGIISPQSKYYVMFADAYYAKGKIRSLASPNSCGALVKDANLNDQGTWTCHLYYNDKTNGTILTNRYTNVTVSKRIESYVDSDSNASYKKTILHVIILVSIVLSVFAFTLICICCTQRKNRNRRYDLRQDAEGGEENGTNEQISTAFYKAGDEMIMNTIKDKSSFISYTADNNNNKEENNMETVSNIIPTEANDIKLVKGLDPENMFDNKSYDTKSFDYTETNENNKVEDDQEERKRIIEENSIISHMPNLKGPIWSDTHRMNTTVNSKQTIVASDMTKIGEQDEHKKKALIQTKTQSFLNAPSSAWFINAWPEIIAELRDLFKERKKTSSQGMEGA